MSASTPSFLAFRRFPCWPVPLLVALLALPSVVFAAEKEMLPAVALALMVKSVLLVIDATVAPAGMPVPEMGWPTSRPVVLGAVRALLFEAIFTPLIVKFWAMAVLETIASIPAAMTRIGWRMRPG